MIRNEAHSLKVLKSGNKKAIAKLGIVKMSASDIAARNADEVAHADYVQNHKYRDDRQEHYPTHGEQLGAIWKILEAQATGNPVPEDAQAIWDKVNAVKAQFKKPIAPAKKPRKK